MRLRCVNALGRLVEKLVRVLPLVVPALAVRAAGLGAGEELEKLRHQARLRRAIAPPARPQQPRRPTVADDLQLQLRPGTVPVGDVEPGLRVVEPRLEVR